MSNPVKLSETPSEYWGNSILFCLAEALGEQYELTGDIRTPEKVYVLDPDELLARALKTIKEEQND